MANMAHSTFNENVVIVGLVHDGVVDVRDGDHHGQVLSADGSYEASSPSCPVTED